MSSRRIAVCLEITPKQTFASALDWPGWCRAGQDESAALETLASYAERYAPVAEQAGVSLPAWSPRPGRPSTRSPPRHRRSCARARGVAAGTGTS
jgi:hypothetical protein